MIFLWLLLTGFVSLNAQEQSAGDGIDTTTVKSTAHGSKTDTLIENKNVNIIVNVDPKEVAKELWDLIQTRLDTRPGRRSMPNEQTIEELEKIVTPVIGTTRRNNGPTAFEVAYALDHVTRKALLRDHLHRPTIEDEIDTREIVARMMFKLQLIIEREKKPKFHKPSNNRRNFNDLHNDRYYDARIIDEDRDSVSVIVRLRKHDILRESLVYAKK